MRSVKIVVADIETASRLGRDNDVVAATDEAIGRKLAYTGVEIDKLDPQTALAAVKSAGYNRSKVFTQGDHSYVVIGVHGGCDLADIACEVTTMVSRTLL